jgi:hypothetical protein
MTVASIDSSIAIVMKPFAVRLQAVKVDEAPLCPGKDDGGARELWESVRARYDGDALSDRWAIQLVAAYGVAREELGTVDTTRLVQQVLGVGGMEYTSERIRKEGYAWSYSGIRLRRFDWWRYPYLESHFGGHFVEPLFGELHRFRFGREEGGALEIVFCPKSDRHPYIEGTLSVARDSSLLSASWRFVTKTHPEEAGGEVMFTPLESGGRGKLLPMSGLFWRVTPSGVYQEWQEYRSWHECTEEPNPVYCGKR